MAYLGDPYRRRPKSERARPRPGLVSGPGAGTFAFRVNVNLVLLFEHPIHIHGVPRVHGLRRGGVTAG